ncbi:COP9 signalosome [Halteromyces radiatus]|uniref:COP9 signalosome n=1 Tax=Halteromyces radiatus TaxID=101107 RepID=UPI0022205819|nr:COP9 signalosome [Halteromyces radiatus]KAI8083017.1 COP9 signalosome [Halteromyces radiatus]
MIETYITTKNYSELLSACEEYELKYGTLTDPSFSLYDLYPAYLGSYIIADDLNSARFLRKRMLGKAKLQGCAISTETDQMWQVCVALWKRNYKDAYILLNDTSRWSIQIQPMISDILESIRERMATLLSKAYSTLTMDDVIDYFGMQEADITQALLTKGWSYDTNTKIFTTRKPDVSQRESSNFGQLSAIADMVLHLEKF